MKTGRSLPNKITLEHVFMAIKKSYGEANPSLSEIWLKNTDYVIADWELGKDFSSQSETVKGRIGDMLNCE